MRVDVPTVVVVALGIAVGAGFLVGGATSAAAFGLFNPDWDGTSDLRSIADEEGSEPVVLRNASDYDEYGDGDVAFVLAPESEYTARESSHVGQFVENGGTLVVADPNSSQGVALLASIGVRARPIGPTLRDERLNYRSPALPVATNVSTHPLVADVSSLTLNHGTGVEPDGATVLIASSEYSYLDRDGSESLDDDETVRSYPIATVEPVGEGQVVVVSDPSVFINAMQGQAGNEAFTRSLVADANHTLVDVSKTSLPPLVAALLTIRESALLQVGLGLASLLAIAVTGRVLRRRRTGTDPLARLDEGTIRKGFRRRYPGDDTNRLLESAKGVKGYRDKPEDDE